MVEVLRLLPWLGYHAIVGNSLMTPETNREKPLRLALIGMSGAGKTFWTKRLAASGYPAVSCDHPPEGKLLPRLLNRPPHRHSNLATITPGAAPTHTPTSH